jgi:uncharacterized protein
MYYAHGHVPYRVPSVHATKALGSRRTVAFTHRRRRTRPRLAPEDPARPRPRPVPEDPAKLRPRPAPGTDAPASSGFFPLARQPRTAHIPLVSDHVRFVSAVADVDSGTWNGLCDADTVPFLEWEWLHALETSGAVSPEEGWLPVHAVYERDGAVIAAAPLYVRSHSWGEFVFDHVWADVAEQLDIRYYPKLVGTLAMTPAPGYQFLLHPALSASERTVVHKALFDAIDRFSEANDLSGSSFLYTDDRWREALPPHGYAEWEHQGFVWRRQGDATFDAYLARFTKNQRRNICRERRAVSDAGVRVRVVRGNDAPDELFSRMFHFYRETNRQFGPWAAFFLNEAFFDALAQHARRRLLFVIAENGSGDTVAASLFLHKGARIWGRYWGTDEFVNGLHFEVCYYKPIEWAIENGVDEFDPGMGSEHKIRRGFVANRNVSIHRFHDPRLQAIFEANVGRFNQAAHDEIDFLNDSAPLKANRQR